MIRIVFIVEQSEAKMKILAILKKFNASIQTETSLQNGIEFLEKSEFYTDLIICNSLTSGTVLLKCLMSVSSTTPCILLTDTVDSLFKTLNLGTKTPLEVLKRTADFSNLEQSISLLFQNGHLQDQKTPDSEFIAVKVKSVVQSCPIKFNLYCKTGENEYSKISRREAQIEAADLEKFSKQNQTEYLFVHRINTSELLDNTQKKLNELAEAPTPNRDQVREISKRSHETVHNLIEKIGFTPEVQELAKKTVEVTLKILGKSPQLSDILRELKQEKGKYITSHSLMLGEISCAIAYKVGWSSSSTFLKLVLAAFLHDLPLRGTQMAEYQTMDDAKESNALNEEDLARFKLHPIKAAEFARKFNEIPSDVDSILLLHHERPDGTGFPRGLFHTTIGPLASLFIISHDLLNFLLEANFKSNLETFLAQNSSKYYGGHFKKITRSLISGVPLND